MEGLCYNYNNSLPRLSQYKFLLTPDYSLYADMPRAVQLYNVFRNRWRGAYWQAQGLTVIPTISWSVPKNDEFLIANVFEDKCLNDIENEIIVFSED